MSDLVALKHAAGNTSPEKSCRLNPSQDEWLVPLQPCNGESIACCPDSLGEYGAIAESSALRFCSTSERPLPVPRCLHKKHSPSMINNQRGTGQASRLCRADIIMPSPRHKCSVLQKISDMHQPRTKISAREHTRSPPGTARSKNVFSRVVHVQNLLQFTSSEIAVSAPKSKSEHSLLPIYDALLKGPQHSEGAPSI